MKIFGLALLLSFACAIDTADAAMAQSVGLYYATTRLNEATTSNPTYGGKRHLDLGGNSAFSSIDYGQIAFSRPDMGPALTSPPNNANWTVLRQVMSKRDSDWKANDFRRLEPMNESTFFDRVRNFRGKILIYVHGYDITFQQAACEFGELIDECKRRGADDNTLLPLLFSWPSPGITADYTGDEANLEWSEKPFRMLINRLALEKNANAQMDLIAHSMGSRLAFWYAMVQANAGMAPPFQNIFLSCADMDMHTAEQKKDDLQNMVSQRVYIFTNDQDQPLLTSQILHKEPRLGRPTDNGTAVRQGPASIASNLVGPGFASGARSTASDMLANLITNQANQNPNSTFAQFAKDASDTLLNRARNREKQSMPNGETQEITAWLSANNALSKEFGPKASLVDTTGLVTINMGHRLPWPLVAGLILQPPGIRPFTTYPVHKRPDATTLTQMGGKPQYLYKYEKVDMERLAP